MFTQDYHSLQNKYTHNTNFLVPNGGKDSSAELDLQYQLYAKYMQLSKQQFAVQQMLIIKDTQNLLQSLNLSARLDMSKDVSSTMESFSYEEDFDNSISQEFSCIERRTPKKITRKGTRHSVLKPSARSNDEFQQIINQIQRNCTEHTLNVVKSLLQEHKKNMNKIVEIQKKQKNICRIEQKSQKIEQENIIAKAKLSEIEQKLKLKDDEIRVLKQKLNHFKVTEKENMRSAQKMSVSAKCISEEQYATTICSSQSNKNNFLSQYLDTKEKSNIQRMTKIKQIETKIQSLIEDSVMKNREQDCNKCCQMIKKIKQSVMNYRTYLEEESQECQKMYNMLKAEIENTLKTKDLPNSNLFHSLE